MVEIESGDVTAMVDSSSAELLQEIDEKKKKLRFGPIVTILAILCALGLFAGEAPLLLQIFVAIVGVLGIYFAFWRDTLAKTVVLFYGFDPTLERAYATLHESVAKLASCAGHWHISASAKVYERKYHAGASALVARKSTSIRRAAPPFLKTNIETVSIGVGRQTMFLFLVSSSMNREKLERLDMTNSKFLFRKQNLSKTPPRQTLASLVRLGAM